MNTPHIPRQSDIFYSLPEVWDFCLEKIYNKPDYITGLTELMSQHGIARHSLILDAGCGSGFPAIDLIEKGFRVIGVDKSSEMVRQVKLNAKKRGVSIEAYNAMWGNLSEQFDQIFDFVYCRGNSLVYAASWEQNWIVPERSREEIVKAIENFYLVLKPGGLLYIDVTSKDEKPHKENIGVIQTSQGPIQIIWEIKYDPQNLVRTWIISLKFLDKGKEINYPSYSYFLPHEELIKIIQKTGFKKIDKYVQVDGENNYNVFIAKK